MQPDIRHVLTECVTASIDERMTFPQIVGKLMEVTVERYHTDLCRGDNTYYLATGESAVLPTGKGPGAPAAAFSAAAVEQAVRGAQAGQIGYNEFCRRVLEAGCAGWQVSMTGKRVVYYGRTGETHVELFPSKS
jgi:uncharacterized protein YbcV (DUF1398 family)